MRPREPDQQEDRVPVRDEAAKLNARSPSCRHAIHREPDELRAAQDTAEGASTLPRRAAARDRDGSKLSSVTAVLRGAGLARSCCCAATWTRCPSPRRPSCRRAEIGDLGVQRLVVDSRPWWVSASRCSRVPFPLGEVADRLDKRALLVFGKALDHRRDLLEGNWQGANNALCTVAGRVTVGTYGTHMLLYVPPRRQEAR